MALCISAGPLADALASIRIGSAASFPSSVMNTRSVILILSEGATDAGSFEHVLRRRRNSVTRLDATSAVFDAGASKASPGLARGRSCGRHRTTWDMVEKR